MDASRSNLSWLRLLAAAVLATGGCKGVIEGGGPARDDDDERKPADAGALTKPDARTPTGRTPDASTPDPDPDARVPDPGKPDARLPDPGKPDARVPDEGELTFRRANLTNFESYPEPDSEECNEFSGCEYEGLFAFVDGKQSEAWVKAHNIVAIHNKDADAYALKHLRLRADGHELDVTVYDECADSDCGGCCTRNSRETGFLIDIEKYTMQRFGLGDGIVEWACLDCK